jgi:hypothetical protein
LLFGFGFGALVVELIVTGLSALGAAAASGPVGGQVAVLAVPAAITATAGSMGAAGSLITPSGIMMTTVAAVVGSLTAENLDVHVLALHVPVGPLATFAVHAPTMLLLAGGLWWRTRQSDLRSETDVRPFHHSGGCSNWATLVQRPWRTTSRN